MRKEKIIVIGGGVGPMAGVELHKKIIENTATDGTDQAHLEVHHFSCSHNIVDRTEYLSGKVSINPATGMFRTMQMAQSATAATGKEVVAGIPCNTFHAPKIFECFMQLLVENEVKIQVLHMLEETVDLICQILPRARTIGLMSSTGTRSTRVYHDIFEPRGFRIVEIPQSLQSELHDSIYNAKWGIKAESPITIKARENFEKYANILCRQGIEAIVLGCTEIPLALPEKEFNSFPLVDPMLALARALIREANPDKLKPLQVF